MIRKIAPETDRAHRNKVTITVALRGAKSPKLRKITVTQKINSTRNGIGIERPPCSNSNNRACPIAMLKLMCLRLKRMLNFVLWREFLDFVEE